MTISVELDYIVNVQGVSQAALHARMAAAVVDPVQFEVLGVSLTSDVTSDVGATQVKRAIVLSLLQPRFVPANNPPGVGVLTPLGIDFTGSVVSTSADDAPGHAGVSVVTVAFTDAGGAPHTETLTLNGVTPVKMTNHTKRTVTGVTFAASGTFATSMGLITIFADPFVPAESPEDEDSTSPVQVVGTVMQSFPTMFPAGSDQKAPFQGLLSAALAEQVETPVIALDPVLS